MPSPRPPRRPSSASTRQLLEPLSSATRAGQIAFYRAFFAGLVLLPTLRRADIQFADDALMLACFAS